MSFKTIFTEPWPRIIGIPIVGLIMTFVYKEPPFEFTNFAVSVFITSIIWQGDYMIITGFRKIWPSFQKVEKRILISFLSVFVFNVSADIGMCESLAQLGFKDFNDWEDYFGTKLGILMGISLIIATFYETGYFFSQWKKQALETEEIKSQQLKSELSVLKNQISPHFLFNSLNTLITLIGENQDKAVLFTEKLSDFYRYTLQHKEKEIVDLKTELEFSKAYVFLMKMRFEKSLHVNIDISSKYLTLFTVPLTLQILIENAIKHNVISSAKPLQIDIYSENGKSLIIRNNLQKKNKVEQSLKTGLENIRRRYLLLSNQFVEVIETKDHFMVTIPLLNVQTKANNKIEI